MPAFLYLPAYSFALLPILPSPPPPPCRQGFSTLCCLLLHVQPQQPTSLSYRDSCTCAAENPLGRIRERQKHARPISSFRRHAWEFMGEINWRDISANCRNRERLVHNAVYRVCALQWSFERRRITRVIASRYEILSLRRAGAVYSTVSTASREFSE